MSRTVLSAVCYGEYQPVAANDTRENKAQNRRIEIVLVPLQKEKRCTCCEKIRRRVRSPAGVLFVILLLLLSPDS